jgi:hypothetical protein
MDEGICRRLRPNSRGDGYMTQPCIINHVMQTEDKNCMSACIAMVTGIDIDRVTKEFHKGYCDCNIDPHEYLAYVGMPFRRCMAGERGLMHNHIYFMCVPSLNIQGGLHEVVAQINNDGTWYILDPNMGKENRKVYIAGPDKDLNPEIYIPLTSYVLEYEFKLEDIKESYDNPKSNKL